MTLREEIKKMIDDNKSGGVDMLVDIIWKIVDKIDGNEGNK